MPSTVVFVYRLSPREVCYSFLVDNKILSNGMVFEAILDAIDIQFRGDYSDFIKLRDMVDSVMDSIIAAHAFYSMSPLSYVRLNWVEMKENIPNDKTIIGLFDPAFKLRGYPRRDHPDNEKFHKACALFPYTEATPELRRALKDYRMALLQLGEDAYFYAYRAVENIRLYFAPSKEGDWHLMHEKLGTSKEFIEPLTKQAKDARHGNYSAVLTDGDTRNKCLDISRKVLENFVRYLGGTL